MVKLNYCSLIKRMVKLNHCSLIKRIVKQNYSVREINIPRERFGKHECNTEIPGKNNGTTHEYNREMSRKSEDVTNECNKEMPIKCKGPIDEYKRGVLSKNNLAIFKQAELDGREIRDEYKRERPRKINGTVVKKVEIDGRERPRKMNGTVVKKVELDGRVVTVTVTCESKIVDGWIEKNGGFLLGMDLEWKPNFLKGGSQNKAALLQLCGDKSCLVVQLLYLDSMPTSLVGILSDSKVKIAGVGVDNDAKKLYKDHGVKCRGLVDLQYLFSVKFKRKDYWSLGLKKLAKEVLGVSINKKEVVKLSDWSIRELKPCQIEYACIDAFLSFSIAEELLRDGWFKELNLEEFTRASFKGKIG